MRLQFNSPRKRPQLRLQLNAPRTARQQRPLEWRLGERIHPDDERGTARGHVDDSVVEQASNSSAPMATGGVERHQRALEVAAPLCSGSGSTSRMRSMSSFVAAVGAMRMPRCRFSTTCSAVSARLTSATWNHERVPNLSPHAPSGTKCANACAAQSATAACMRSSRAARPPGSPMPHNACSACMWAHLVAAEEVHHVFAVAGRGTGAPRGPSCDPGRTHLPISTASVLTLSAANAAACSLSSIECLVCTHGTWWCATPESRPSRLNFL
jgi:hypothetical protein